MNSHTDPLIHSVPIPSFNPIPPSTKFFLPSIPCLIPLQPFFYYINASIQCLLPYHTSTYPITPSIHPFIPPPTYPSLPLRCYPLRPLPPSLPLPSPLPLPPIFFTRQLVTLFHLYFNYVCLLEIFYVIVIFTIKHQSDVCENSYRGAFIEYQVAKSNFLICWHRLYLRSWCESGYEG